MKRTKKPFSIFLAAIMVFGVFTAIPMTVSAAEMTTDFMTPDANGVYHIDESADLESFSTNYASLAGKTVVLDNDIDMTGTSTFIQKFNGTFDGQGYAIKNLKIQSKNEAYSGFFRVVNGDLTVRNVSFIDCEALGPDKNANKQRIGIIVGQVYASTKPTLRFENVYVSGTATGVNHVGGFVGRADSAVDMYFNNCVSAATVQAISYTSSGSTTWGGSFGGFVGTLGIGNTSNVVMTDCAFIGKIPTVPNTASAFGGFTSANVTLERCISLATIAKQQSGQFFCFSNQSKVATQAQALTTQFIDCYSFGSKAIFARASAATSGHWSVVLGNGYDVSITYGGQKVYEHKDSTVDTLTKENGTLSKVDDMNAAFESFTEALTPENFATLCPGIASSGKWVVTQNKVTHTDKVTGVGAEHAIILPATVAEMINAPIKSDAPNAVKYFQTKTNGSKYDIRFLGLVNVDDSSNYKSVGFKVVVKIKDSDVIMTKTISSPNVYRSIYADGFEVTARSKGADYISALEITELDSNVVYEISILSFAEHIDGMIYDYSGARNLTIKNGEKIG